MDVAASAKTFGNEQQQKQIVDQMRASANACESSFAEWKSTWGILEEMIGNHPNFINDIERTTMIADDKLGNISSAVIASMNTFGDALQLLEDAQDPVPKHRRKRPRSRNSTRGE